MATTLGHLSELYPASQSQSLLLVVSDVGQDSPQAWKSPGGKSWVEVLQRHHMPSTSVFLFDHGLSFNDSFTWAALLTKAEQLLVAIKQLRDDNAALVECPIQIVCLGLGGLIVKEAIQTAYRRSNYFAEFLFVFAGIVFIGSPHSTSQDMKAWHNVSQLPKLSGKRTLNLDDKDVSMLSHTCKQFESAIDAIDRPILSVFDGLPTKLGGLIGSKRVLLFGAKLSTIDVSSEEIVSSESNYPSLHEIPIESRVFTTISSFIQRTFGRAQLRITVESSKARPLNHMDEITIRTKSVLSPENLLDKESADTPLSGLATFGSTTAEYEVIGSVPEFKSSTNIIRLPCYIHGAVTRNKNFHDRWDILQEIEQTLLPEYQKRDENGERQINAFSICGLGGVGKTEIAAEFMFAQKAKFDAIFWVQADEEIKMRDTFSLISVSLGLESEKEAKDPVASTEFVKAWLANPTRAVDLAATDESKEANWLLIFDNVDDPEILNDFWPNFGKGSILITSRDPLAKTNVYASISGTDLSPFKDQDAAEFLAKLTNSEEDVINSGPSSEALEVAQKLGGLPLGLAQIAGLINRKDLTFGEFLDQYKERKLAEIHRENLRWGSKNYSHTISTVWSLETLSGPSKALLDVISLLDPDMIKENILTHGAIDISLEDYPKSEESYADARFELIKRSLIKRNKVEKQLRVHRLTQDVARSKLTRPLLRLVFEAAVHLVSAVWPYTKSPSQRHTTTRWKTCEQLVPSVIRLQDLYTSYIEPDHIFTACLTFAKLSTDAAWYIHERGGNPKLSVLLDMSERICSESDEDSRNIRSDIYYTRGAEAAVTNDMPTAFKYNNLFLNLRLEISQTAPQGTRDPLLAQAYTQASNANLDRGNYDICVDLYGKSIDVWKSLPNFKETMLSIAVANLATTLWLRQENTRASEILLRNLQAREAEYGINDTDSFRTGKLFHVLGNVRTSEGKLAESFDYHYRALLQYKSTVGNDHRRTADMCCIVSAHYIRLGKYTSAKSLLDHALRIYERRVYYKREIARTSYLLSRAYDALDEPDLSRQFRSTAIELYRFIKPDDDRRDDEISGQDFDNIIAPRDR